MVPEGHPERHRDTWQDGDCEAHDTARREADPDARGREPEERVLRREENRRLLQAVLALPEKYRDVIHLFYYEELSVKEIARATGRGESTVTSQLTRGRELLRKSLKEGYDFG